MKAAVMLTVTLESGWDPEAVVEVFTNQGSGDVDYNTPLLRVPLATLVKVIEPGGIGADPLGAMPIGHGLAHAEGDELGIGEIPLGEGPIGTSLAVIEVEALVEQGYGNFKFAARTVDKAGNIQEPSPTEFNHFVSGEDPPTPTRLSVEAYDEENDQITFGVGS